MSGKPGVGIHRCEFIRQPFKMFAALQNGEIGFDKVAVISDRRIHQNLRARNWTWAGAWNFERFIEGERGGIAMRISREGEEPRKAYTGAYALLLREPIYEFSVPYKVEGGDRQIDEVRNIFTSFDDIFQSMTGRCWVYLSEETNEIGATFANQADAVMFSAMCSANKL